MINELMKQLSELPNVTLSDGQEYIQLYDAMETVKRALEQEPCDDAVSRQAVLDLIADYDLSMGQVVKGIHELPPVTPQPKTGRWIRVDKDKCKCDQCEVICFIGVYPNGDKNYCPNCGAKMVERSEV